MATPRLCSIEGCGKPHEAHGWCGPHYKRWLRHGDPLAGRNTSPGEAERFFCEIVLAHEGDECLSWPYSRNTKGYGKVRLGRRSHIVSRLACELVHGPAKSPVYEAAHSCGNGHLGCVNPQHLSWKTRRENEADKFIHGTRSRGGAPG
jgi:hypothetical protein